MPKRWERELQRLGDVPAPLEEIRSRSTHPSPGSEPTNGLPPMGQRVIAGIVAFGVFTAAAAFGWQAFMGDGGTPSSPGVAGKWPVATVTLASEGAQKIASLSIGGREQQGVFGSSTSPNEEYPYQWSNPRTQNRQPLAIPLGAEVSIDGDVRIKEILFGNADELDAGRGPDSGSISSEQPTFEQPYFPVQDQARREYWKLFGTWADGSVLDVYFEVRWVEPRVDLTDTSVDIVVTPETLEAELLYGGQRRGTMGDGSYGGTSVILEWAGYDADTLYFPVAAGSTINVVGDDLESWKARLERRQEPETFETIESVPDAVGPSTLRLSVEWGGGTGSFRFPIEIVEPEASVPVDGDVSFLEQLPPRSYEGETLDSRPLDPANFEGRVIIAIAWESSCEPCRAALRLVREEIHSSRLTPTAVGLVTKWDANAARSMARDLALGFPSVVLEDDPQEWGIKPLPAIWVIAPDGRVVAERAGSIDERWIAEAVYEATFGNAAPEVTPSSAPDVLRVRCTEQGVEVLTSEVEAQAAGVHVLASPGSAEHAEAIELRPLGWPIVNYSSGSSGVEGEFARQVPPGDVVVSCSKDGDTGRLTVDPRPGEAVVRVIDPGGHFTPWIPTCSLEEQVAFDSGDRVPVDNSLTTEEVVRQLLSGISAGDLVAPAGYLRAHPVGPPIVSVSRGGEVIGSVWVTRDGGEAQITSGFACVGSGVEEGFDTYPAWQG